MMVNGCRRREAGFRGRWRVPSGCDSPWEFEVIIGMLLFVGDIVPIALRFERGIYGV